jgi:hypothetical protein
MPMGRSEKAALEAGWATRYDPAGRKLMSEFVPPQPPLLSPEKARDLARAYKALAGQLTETGQARQASLAMRDSQWWLTYAIALAQTGKDGSETAGEG